MPRLESRGDRASLVARVLNVANTNAWAKAGLMIRESLAPDAKQVDVVVTPSKGVAMQYRNTTGGTSVMAGQKAAGAPVWIRLERLGSFVQASYSTDFALWRLVGQVETAVGSDMYVGIAVTSHNAAVETTATLDTVRIEQ
jgi:regulation of enolase protein 1 (concanavalin A-like superfamily)